MGGRDHSLRCPACGASYSGFNGPDECPCGFSAASFMANEVWDHLAEAIWEHERSPKTSIWHSFWDRITEGGTVAAIPPMPNGDEASS